MVDDETKQCQGKPKPFAVDAGFWLCTGAGLRLAQFPEIDTPYRLARWINGEYGLEHEPPDVDPAEYRGGDYGNDDAEQVESGAEPGETPQAATTAAATRIKLVPVDVELMGQVIATADETGFPNLVHSLRLAMGWQQ